MDLSLFYQLKSSRPQLMNALFYVAMALLIVAIFCYGIFTFKIYLQNQQISKLDKDIAVYGNAEQKASEKKVLDYKKKIDDYAILIANQRIFTNVFDFLEKNTLALVWFSDFKISDTQNQVTILGEVKDLDVLSSQLNIFETDKEYVKEVALSNTQFVNQEKTKFNLLLTLNPKIFTDYQISPVTPAAALINPVNIE